VRKQRGLRAGEEGEWREARCGRRARGGKQGAHAGEEGRARGKKPAGEPHELGIDAERGGRDTE
jgi:hypothetical protein